MPEGRYIAYYRVSTARQGASGLGQEAQRQAVYPTARLEDTVGGIILKLSPPPMPKPSVVVSRR